MYKLFFKPLCDFCGAVLLLLLLSPILAAVALLLALTHRGRIFFIQPRPGKDERIFNVIKFKTMTDCCGEDGKLLPDAERLTLIGRLIRSTSIDELPQLLNVLKGEMSFIGPRPLRVEYLPLYDGEQKRRHHVKPGLSGWAQVHGRNAISWRKKFELDIWYVEHLSFATDCRILMLTLFNILRRKDISQQGRATVEAFNGRN